MTGALVAAAMAALLAAAAPARAASCAVMTIDSATGGITLSGPVRVPVGGCVGFRNDSGPLSVHVTVGSRFATDVAGFSSSSTTYAATTPGTEKVVATQQLTGKRADSSIVVTASPTRSPSVSPRPSPSRTPASPPPAPAPSSSHSQGPQVAPRPSVSPPTPPAVLPLPLPSLSPVSPGPGRTPVVIASPPSTSPSPPAAIVAGPLQPPTNRALGLPAALAALAVVGTATGLLRVLLAEQISTVDGGKSVGSPA